MELCVGFDLDMTLIDPRPGMAALIELLGDEFDTALDAEYFAENLGPPLDVGLRAAGAPEHLISELAPRFRERYPDIVIPRTVALPGAVDALAAVRELDGRAIVVTGKYQPNAVLHLRALEVEVDAVIGGLWSHGKAAALRQHAVSLYVGDHLGDIEGAHAADAVAIAVPNGPCSQAELSKAGADVVLGGLHEFPRWLTDHLRLTDGKQSCISARHRHGSASS